MGPSAAGIRNEEIRSAATFLEADLPFRELSYISKAERRSVDPVYAAHRWWARRPGGVIRGVLLAASLPADTTADEFWTAYRSDDAHLQGLRVFDPFIGGGSIPVEASRLGATPFGCDVDPLAVRIVRHELTRPEVSSFVSAARELLAYLRDKTAELYPLSKSGEPLHYFYLREVRCPDCREEGVLFRGLVLARDSQMSGSVRREAPIVAFCPECFEIHELAPNRKRVACCGHSYPLDTSSYAKGRYICGACGSKSTHHDLKTGAAPLRLIAVEEVLAAGGYRVIRRPSRKDKKALERAGELLSEYARQLWLPAAPFVSERQDPRPLSFGATHPRQLFTTRQLVVFGLAFAWVRRSGTPAEVKDALLLALSNALTTNNVLCSYAPNYGRLAPLFSVRSYSMPWLTVELNPLHPTAGRGTLDRCVKRLIDSCADDVVRYSWDTENREATPVKMRFQQRAASTNIVCGTASARAGALAADAKFDLSFFDPPFFDYIAYSELSEFYRVWFGESTLGGTPLLPHAADPVHSFADQFSLILRSTIANLSDCAPLIFTFHSSSSDAWNAVGLALDRADLLITAMWPVLNDPHMGHHTAAGNCEWDVVVVARRRSACQRSECLLDVRTWKAGAAPLFVSKADQESMRMAIEMASSRFGRPSAS